MATGHLCSVTVVGAQRNAKKKKKKKEMIYLLPNRD
jgi:hypothetical protein